MNFENLISFAGKGVFTTRTFRHGDFLLEYKGELLSKNEACQRERQYGDSDGSFLFYFKHSGKCYW